MIVCDICNVRESVHIELVPVLTCLDDECMPVHGDNVEIAMCQICIDAQSAPVWSKE